MFDKSFVFPVVTPNDILDWYLHAKGVYHDEI